MKTPIYYAIWFAAFSAFAHADEPDSREFTSKTLQLEFETFEDAKKWSLRDLSFAEWLTAVSKSDWIELHKSQTDDFYFAIYRSGNHLIFCENDRKNLYSGASISIRATDDKIAFSVLEEPSMVTLLKWNVVYPSGGTGGQTVFNTWKILDGFSGDVVLDYQVKNDGEENRQALKQTITWNK